MSNEATEIRDPPEPPKPSRFARAIEYIKRNQQQRRAKYQKETPADRAARRTATATVWIAAFTLVTIGVGVSQFIIFKKQLNEMQSSGKQTDALIKANKKLAEAAAVQAQAAQDTAITAHENLIASQRAWIAPIKFMLADINDATRPLRVQMTYQNVGREPARNIRNYLVYGYIREPIPLDPTTWGQNPLWQKIEGIRPKTMCDGAGASVNTVAYPSATTRLIPSLRPMM